MGCCCFAKAQSLSSVFFFWKASKEWHFLTFHNSWTYSNVQILFGELWNTTFVWVLENTIQGDNLCYIKFLAKNFYSCQESENLSISMYYRKWSIDKPQCDRRNFFLYIFLNRYYFNALSHRYASPADEIFSRSENSKTVPLARPRNT